MALSRQQIVQAMLDEGVSLVRAPDGSYWLGLTPPEDLTKPPEPVRVSWTDKAPAEFLTLLRRIGEERSKRAPKRGRTA